MSICDPLVSIIVPLYNSEKYIAETIKSALNQTWTNKEIIIVDDGSTDQSLSVAKSFESDVVKVFSQINKGASSARNEGLLESKGEYIQFLDADDLLSPEKIEKQVACLGGSFTHLSISHTIHFNDGENILNDIQSDHWYEAGSKNPVDFLTKLYAGNEVMPGYGGMITVHSWLSPRILIEKAGPWNEGLSVDDDGEFFCRVVLASNGIIFCKDAFNYYRKFNHRRSLSAQNNRKSIESAILSNDLKYSHLKSMTNDPIIDKIFARYYWWTGVPAYPRFKDLSKYCIQKAKQLGYSGEKYVGGPGGHRLTRYFGWKIARIIAYCRHLLKEQWA